MKSFPDPIFTPVAETIKANREDERKILMYSFAERLRAIANRATGRKMTAAEIVSLLNGDADRIENEAGEPNNV